MNILLWLQNSQLTKKLAPMRRDPVPEMVWTVMFCWERKSSFSQCAVCVYWYNGNYKTEVAADGWLRQQCHMIASTLGDGILSKSAKLTLALFRTSLLAPRASSAHDLVNSPKPPMARYSLSSCLAEMMASAYSLRGGGGQTEVIKCPPFLKRQSGFKINTTHEGESSREELMMCNFHTTTLRGAT